MLKVIVPAAILIAASCAPANERDGDTAVSHTGPKPAEQSKVLAEQGVNQTSTQEFVPEGGRGVIVNSNHELQVADLYINLGDPNGQREFASYLLRPEEWMLVKSEMLSPTQRHVRFQRVTRKDGRPLHELDLLRPR